MKILYLEAFYGGSHRNVADNIRHASRHRVELLTLPARFWKWRMRGAAIHFAGELGVSRIGSPSCDAGKADGASTGDLSRYDLIVSGGMMSVADLRALVGPDPPILLYAHETQLTYPSPSAREADLHFAFTDLTNMLAATHIAFNSATHRRAYLDALPGFLRRLPEYRPMWVADEIAARSTVCYPGIECPDAPRDGIPAETRPLILWNHRWEHDKNPAAFFDALRELDRRGLEFSVALLGENFQVVPEEFLAARQDLAHRIVHFGYAAGRDAYRAWLERADIVVSTAVQENFGVSVLEAVAHGARPLVPNRLAYPELIPEEYRDSLYATDEELVDRLEQLCSDTPHDELRAPAELVAHARRFSWEERIGAFDALFEEVAANAARDARPPHPGVAG